MTADRAAFGQQLFGPPRIAVEEQGDGEHERAERARRVVRAEGERPLGRLLQQRQAGVRIAAVLEALTVDLQRVGQDGLGVELPGYRQALARRWRYPGHEA